MLFRPRGGGGGGPGGVRGAPALPLLRQLCTFGGVGDELEYVVIGGAPLGGASTDEVIRRNAPSRAGRSEERRVGEEGRSWWAAAH